jgi:hypothetical protein
MNFCKRYQCNTCDTLIDCRIGMSNRDIQPFQFVCPKCKDRITFTLGCDDLMGATEIKDFKGPFTGENHFLELHLDFPVLVGKYQPGDTVFFRVLEALGHDGFHHLKFRLDLLNKLYPKQRDLSRLIVQYKRNDIRAFEKVVDNLKDLHSIELKSHKKQDILAALYSATSIMSSPLTIHAHNEELSKEMPKMLLLLHSRNNEALGEFFDSIIDSSFLKTTHLECISLYPKLIKLDLPLRPALYYDYTEEDLSAVSMRVSTSDFDTCNNTYKDLAEVYSRQLVLVAGLNNLLHRGDSDLFSDSVRLNNKGNVIKNLSSLNDYANVDLGCKLNAIDDSFFKFNLDAIDTKLRNGIAHFKYDYDDAMQIITYSSAKEGLFREQTIEITFITFMRKMLLLFREVHSLNHLTKALLYHSIFILNKDV